MQDEKETKLKAPILRSLRIVTLLSAVAALPMAAHGALTTDSLLSGGGSSDNSGYGALAGTENPVPDRMSPPVPKHGPMILLGGGLMGIGFWGRRRKRMQE